MAVNRLGDPYKPDKFIELDIKETRELYAALQRVPQPSVSAKVIPELIIHSIQSATEEVGKRCPSLEIDLMSLGVMLAEQDFIHPFLPEFNETRFRAQDTKTRVEFRKLLRRKIVHYADYEQTIATWMLLFKQMCVELFKQLPDSDIYRGRSAEPFEVDYLDTIPDLHALIPVGLYYPYCDKKAEQFQIFDDVRWRLFDNLKAVSGDPEEPIFPDSPQMRKLPPRELLPIYLSGTTFHSFFLNAKVALDLPREARFEHCVITGGSGHGKTQLLQKLILNDLLADEPPTVVVVDSQGQMLENIARLQMFAERDIVILDPRDNPALNVFDINQGRLRRYGPSQQEQVFNHTIETFSYLFNSLLGADLTVRQSVLFNYLIYLMLALPRSLGRNATLLDLMHLMDDAEPYRPAIDALDPIPRDFFVHDFGSNQYNQTKEQIRYRLQAIVGNPTLARLFLAPTNTVDFFEELNRGTVILIDTSKAFLGAKNSSYLGRIAISLILQAVLERGATPGTKRPVHLYIDEAGEYFDKSIDTFLTEARKQRAGITLAHQYMNQMTPELRASIAANTSIKFAGGLSNQDARLLANDMRADPEFILNQPKLSFACFIRGHTQRALALHVKPGVLETEQRMSDEEYHALRERNRARVTSPSAFSPRFDVRQPSENPDDTDTSPEPRDH